MSFELRRPKRVFTAAAIGIALLISAFIPFFSQIVRDISIFSLVFGQIALIFLYVLAAFPRANNRQIVKLSLGYGLFIGVCFLALSIIPFPVANRLFHIADLSKLPIEVLVDIPTLIFLNLGAFVYMNLGFYISNPAEKKSQGESSTEDSASQDSETKKHVDSENQNSRNTEKGSKAREAIKNLQAGSKQMVQEAIPNLGSLMKIQKELKSEVENLFETYFEGKESIKDKKQKIVKSYAGETSSSEPNQSPSNDLEPRIENTDELNRIEEILIKNLDTRIQEAVCLDKNGQIMNSDLIKWRDVDGHKLAELFKKNRRQIEDLNTGKLMQVLIASENHWYIIARHREFYLALKSQGKDPSPLLEASYRIFSAISKEKILNR